MMLAITRIAIRSAVIATSTRGRVSQCVAAPLHIYIMFDTHECKIGMKHEIDSSRMFESDDHASNEAKPAKDPELEGDDLIPLDYT